MKEEKVSIDVAYRRISTIILPGWEEKKGGVVMLAGKNGRQPEDDLTTAIYSIIYLEFGVGKKRERKDLIKKRPWFTTP